jgi:hypothetical protein
MLTRREMLCQCVGGAGAVATSGDGDVFFGYHHLDVMRNGRQVGMLSVNDTSGEGLVPY